MKVRSMTGYGYVENNSGERDLTVEVRSLNNRYFDVYTSLPSFLNPLEPEIKQLVAGVASRGKVEVAVRLREYQSSVHIHVDDGAVEAAKSALKEIGRLADIAAEPSYRDILAFDGVIQTERRRDAETYRDDVVEALRKALAAWNETREAEGRVTAADLTRHLDRLRRCVGVFAESADEIETMVFDAVRKRFREVLGDDADEQRVYAEAAVLMVKHATSEEVVRLQSHIDSFAGLLNAGGSIGKRLDFICQEMNREINTTGSKTILSAVQDAVIEAKDAVEAIREQLRNIE